MMSISNQLGSKSLTEQRTSNGWDDRDKKCILPTGQKPTWRHSTETHTNKSPAKSTEKSTSHDLPTSQKPPGYSLPRHTPRSRLRSRPAKSTKSTKMQLKPPSRDATMKSIGWSPMQTCKDDYLVKEHLEVNATHQ